ncbi:MAG: hypothetical protein SF029_12995 [bacterium]|nr:hypothetical protein [bacterium]
MNYSQNLTRSSINHPEHMTKPLLKVALLLVILFSILIVICIPIGRAQPDSTLAYGIGYQNEYELTTRDIDRRLELFRFTIADENTPCSTNFDIDSNRLVNTATFDLPDKKITLRSTIEIASIRLFDGRVERLTRNTMIETSVTLSPDRTRLAYLSWNASASIPSKPKLNIAFVDGDIEHQFDLPVMGIRSLLWSPDGRYIGVMYSFGLLSIDLETRQGRHSYISANASIINLSPDSRFIAYFVLNRSDPNRRYRLVVVDVQTLEQQTIAFVHGYPTRPIWSGDSRYIAYMTRHGFSRPSQLVIRDLEGVIVQQFSFDKFNDANLLDWTTDQERFVFSARYAHPNEFMGDTVQTTPFNLYVLEANTGKLRVIERGPGPYIGYCGVQWID